MPPNFITRRFSSCSMLTYSFPFEVRFRTSFRIASSTSSGERPLVSRYSASGAWVSGASARCGRAGRARRFPARRWSTAVAGFRRPPVGAISGIGVQIDLHLRVGEHHRADIAAFHHDRLATPMRRCSSRMARRTPGARRHFRSRSRHLRLADGGGDVLAVQQHACSPSNSMRAACASCSRRCRSSRSMPARRAHSATARYIAPVSI